MSNHSTLTPYDLGDNPHLAVLEVLHTALAMTRLALIAAHAELTEIDPAAVPSDIQVLAAEHVLAAAHTLERALVTYRRVTDTEPHWVQTPSRGVEAEPF